MLWNVLEWISEEIPEPYLPLILNAISRAQLNRAAISEETRNSLQVPRLKFVCLALKCLLLHDFYVYFDAKCL